MAIAASYELEDGKSIIRDACYSGKNEAELEKLREHARNVAKQILHETALQEMKEKRLK